MDYPEFSGQDLNVSLQVEGRGRCDSRRCEGNLTTEADLEWCNHKPRNASSCQKMEEARNRFFPRVSRGSVVLSTPWFQLSDTDFGFLASRTMRQQILPVILNCQVCGNLLQQPQRYWLRGLARLVIFIPRYSIIFVFINDIYIFKCTFPMTLLLV